MFSLPLLFGFFVVEDAMVRRRRWRRASLIDDAVPPFPPTCAFDLLTFAAIMSQPSRRGTLRRDRPAAGENKSLGGDERSDKISSFFRLSSRRNRKFDENEKREREKHSRISAFASRTNLLFLRCRSRRCRRVAIARRSASVVRGRPRNVAEAASRAREQ